MATPKPAPTESNPRRSQRVIHFLTQEELKRLLAIIKPKRDRTIFLLAYRHGLRASEIGLLRRTDVDLKQGRITVHRLKGSLSAIYPMCSGLQTAAPGPANKEAFRLTFRANKLRCRPTIAANEPTLNANSLQTAMWTQIPCTQKPGPSVLASGLLIHSPRSRGRAGSRRPGDSRR